MAKYKTYNLGQMKMLAVSFDRQILPGSFEYSLAYLIDHELDLAAFDAPFNNDDNGRPGYDPRLLLKIVLLAYAKGITSSRKIEQLCRENIVFMALSGDLQPDHSTLAQFISRSPEAIVDLFTQVVMTCDDLGLIGKDMFAIDGCKLPSNASKEWRGTHAELDKKRKKIDRAVRRILKRHRDEDSAQNEPDIHAREQAQIKKLRQASKKIKTFLDTEEPRQGAGGRAIKSNLTDNQSATMKTSHGVIQGYTGVAAVDSQHQVVVYAEAFGQGQEHGLLKPMVEGIRANLKENNIPSKTKLTADSGYHDRESLEYLKAQGIDGYIADPGFRARDPRFKDHKAKPERNKQRLSEKFTVKDFEIDIERRSCRCPAGKWLSPKTQTARIHHHRILQFKAQSQDCQDCPLRKRCLKNERQTTPRQVHATLGVTVEYKATSVLERMKEKLDSSLGRHIYSQRLGTVEPVFGHLTNAIGIKRFSLRGVIKVDGQWKLMMALHNILKIHRYGWKWA